MHNRIAVLGANDVASAVAHRLFCEGYAVVIAEDRAPTTTRRRMAFTDAVFDGAAELAGIVAQRVVTRAAVEHLLESRRAIPLVVDWSVPTLVQVLDVTVLIDARMRKREQPERLRGLAPLTIGLGPGFVAGDHVDVAIETAWERLGAIIWEGPTLPLAGEPREIAGHSRDRFVYAPITGRWQTERDIGHAVHQHEPVAQIIPDTGEPYTIEALLDGVIRGITRSGVTVRTGTKVLEIDPRGANAQIQGLGERPMHIAEGVLAAIMVWQRQVNPTFVLR